MIGLLFSPRGRIGRREWWAGGTFAGVLSTVLLLAATSGRDPAGRAELTAGLPVEVLAGGSSEPATLAAALLQAVPPPLLLVTLVSWYCQACLTAKRLHDRGLSGWWQLVGLVPLAGQLWLLTVCGSRAGDPDANRFGAPVSRARAAAEAWRDREPPDTQSIDALIARHAAARSSGDGRAPAPAPAPAARSSPSRAAGGFGRRQAPPPR